MTREDFKEIKQKFREEWWNYHPEITAVGIGEGPSLVVYILDESDEKGLPKEYGGLPVVYEVSGVSYRPLKRAACPWAKADRFRCDPTRDNRPAD